MNTSYVSYRLITKNKGVKACSSQALVKVGSIVSNNKGVKNKGDYSPLSVLNFTSLKCAFVSI